MGVRPPAVALVPVVSRFQPVQTIHGNEPGSPDKPASLHGHGLTPELLLVAAGGPELAVCRSGSELSFHGAHSPVATLSGFAWLTYKLWFGFH